MIKVVEIFWQFFLLGWTSFGGPAAHIGYFRHAFVERLQWLSDQQYAHLIALSQFLPGPGSSQVGFAIGYRRAGLSGGIAAFLGFTLPSFAILVAVAMSSHTFFEAGWYQGVIAGLKLLAVVVVADAIIQMFRSFCQSSLTVGLCVFSAAVLLITPGVLPQMAVLLLAAGIGWRWLPALTDTREACHVKIWPLALFGLLLLVLPLVAVHNPLLTLFSDFYQAGSMVFGGGHVVLPLLQNTTKDLISTDTFLTGYAAAQAIPGPMFTLSAYLGYFASETLPMLTAAIATIAIFMPGFLLVIGMLDTWQALAGRARVKGAIIGINASVTGLLVAAMVSPVFVSAVHTLLDFAIALIGFYLLRIRRWPVFGLVGVAIAVGAVWL